MRHGNFLSFLEFQKEQWRTANPNLDERQRVAQGVMGLVGETGELVDAIKKWLYHDHEISTPYLVEELGDILWYISELCTSFEISLDAVAHYNIQKLATRYPDGFDAERSKNRGEQDNGND